MRVNRIVGQSSRTLDEILTWREHIYENSYDIRILIGQNDSPVDIAKQIFRQLHAQSQMYRSTRQEHSHNSQQFLDIVQQGLASDGGLYGRRTF
jgi:hypothetical protein